MVGWKIQYSRFCFVKGWFSADGVSVPFSSLATGCNSEWLHSTLTNFTKTETLADYLSCLVNKWYKWNVFPANFFLHKCHPPIHVFFIASLFFHASSMKTNRCTTQTPTLSRWILLNFTQMWPKAMNSGQTVRADCITVLGRMTTI